jgi:CelD/BcsL family acetyltransferase involved in cellulose biosynthesis
MLVGMPLGLEGTPLAAAGAARGEHLLALFRALPDCGSLIVSGGAGGSPPAAGVLSRSVTHVLDLQPGFDAVWNERFSAKNRNMCRKADRGGVVVNAESSQEAARAYHALYAAAAEDREQQADRYPQALFSAFLESGSAELWLARADSEVVAGALLLRGSQDLLYWSGAMKREHRHLAPSNAVLRAAIASGCERGFRYFDFGASTGLSGVEAFKRSFGAQPRACFSTALSTRRNRQLERARRLLARSTKASLTSP